MTRGLYLRDDENGPYLLVKTECGLTCRVPIGPEFCETLDLYIAEEKEQRQKEYAGLVELWRYRDKLEGQQDSLIGQLIANAPDGATIEYAKIGPTGAKIYRVTRFSVRSEDADHSIEPQKAST